MKSTRHVLIVFLLALFLIPGAVRAQSEVTLDEVNVALWPEFDRPEMLVIYRITLSPSVTLPAMLEFNIPAAAGEPHAVAEVALDGDLYNAVYDREVHGDRALIQITASVPEIQIEYYDPTLSPQGDQRQFTYTWMGDYPVEHLSFEVQVPLESENFVLEPSIGSSSFGSNGFEYYTGDTGSHAQGEQFDLSLAYQKETDAPSSQLGQGMYPQPSQGISGDTPGRVNLNEGLRWLAGLFLLALLAGGVFWLYRIRTAGKLSPAPTKRGRRNAGGPEQEIPVAKGPYCHQCGKLASSGDVFCRTCGTRLRAEGK